MSLHMNYPLYICLRYVYSFDICLSECIPLFTWLFMSTSPPYTYPFCICSLRVYVCSVYISLHIYVFCMYLASIICFFVRWFHTSMYISFRLYVPPFAYLLYKYVILYVSPFYIYLPSMYMFLYMIVPSFGMTRPSQ